MNDTMKDASLKDTYNSEGILSDILPDGKNFIGYIYVAEMFIGFLIGKNGVSKRRIEEETKTVLTIPKRGTDVRVSIRGDTYSSVNEALSQISLLINKARQRSMFTHFLSVPATTESLKSSFLMFKEAVLKDSTEDAGVLEVLFQKDYRLHFTLCMLVLGGQVEEELTVDVGRRFQAENASLFSSPLNIHIRGLQCMGNQPRETRVLNAEIEHGSDRERLQIIADKMTDFMVDNHVLLRREYDKVTLHLTVMNVSFNNFKEGTKKLKSFDCSKIIEKFHDWDFGVLIIDEIQLSKRGTFDSENYYQCFGSFKFGARE